MRPLYCWDRGFERRSRWPSGLRRTSLADYLQGLRDWIPPGAWLFVLCVVSRDKMAKRRTIKTKKQVRMKYKVQENTKKKKSHWTQGVYLLCLLVLWVLKTLRRKDYTYRGVPLGMCIYCVLSSEIINHLRPQLGRLKWSLKKYPLFLRCLSEKWQQTAPQGLSGTSWSLIYLWKPSLDVKESRFPFRF